MAFPLLLSANYPSFWKVDVSHGHGVAEIPSRPWYDDSNLATFVWLSTSVAPMSRVMALASPSHLCAQNDSPGHVYDGLDFNVVSPMSRMTPLPTAETTALGRIICLL
ncbi:unnamed protein product [Prunus brigantina]